MSFLERNFNKLQSNIYKISRIEFVPQYDQEAGKDQFSSKTTDLSVLGIDTNWNGAVCAASTLPLPG